MVLHILLDRDDGLILHYGNDSTSGIMTTIDGTGHNGNTFESYGNLLFFRFLSVVILLFESSPFSGRSHAFEGKCKSRFLATDCIS